MEDIRHIPARERELRFTRNRAGSVLLAAGFLLIATAAFLQLTGYDTITPYLPAPLWAMQAAALVPAVLCLIAGSRCLKHAAVIVTPVGVEMVLLAADTFCGPERRTPEPPPDGRLNRRGQPALHDSRQPGNAGPCGPAARQHPAMLRLW